MLPICPRKKNGLKEVKWTKLANGWYKLNTDGLMNGANGFSGCCGLIRDNNGQWVKGFAKQIVAESSLAVWFYV